MEEYKYVGILNVGTSAITVVKDVGEQYCEAIITNNGAIPVGDVYDTLEELYEAKTIEYAEED